MGKVYTEGPKGFRLQDLVTTWIALLVWNCPNARVLPELGEDATIEIGSDVSHVIHLQVKKSTQALDLETLAEVLAHFGGNQSDKCLLDEVDTGRWGLLVAGGVSREEAARHCATNPTIPLSEAKISWPHVKAFRNPIRNAPLPGRENTPLQIKRRSRLQHLSDWPATRLRKALQRFSVWEKANEQRWSPKSGQVVKLFPSMRRTGFDGQGHTQALCG